MKRLIISCALLCAFGVVKVSAQINSPQDLRPIKIVYYGEKANDSMKNPCKGECTTPCAEIYRLIEAPKPGSGDTGAVAFSLGSDQVVVKSILKDPEGNIINEWEEVYDGDVNIVKRQLIEEAAMNGGVTEAE